MANIPTELELNELEAVQELFCLSIYAPYIESNSRINPVKIELKNILREAEAALVSAGAAKSNTEKTLQPIRNHLERNELWPMRHKGLAFFSHPRFFRYYRIPDDSTPYQISVGPGFNLDALAEIIKSNKKYFLLALGHKYVRLYEGDRDTIKPVSIKNFPQNMVATLRIDEYPHSRQTHTVAPATQGKGSEGFHQQYDVRSVDKKMLREFFRRIDKNLHSYLQQHARPLVIAGTEPIVAIYRTVNTYPYLLTDSIAGSSADIDLQDIRQKTWRIVSETS